MGKENKMVGAFIEVGLGKIDGYYPRGHNEIKPRFRYFILRSRDYTLDMELLYMYTVMYSVYIIKKYGNLYNDCVVYTYCATMSYMHGCWPTVFSKVMLRFECPAVLWL